MSFFASGAFWGVLIILWGLSLVLKSFFPKINIPMGSIFVAICFILFGVQLLMSSMGEKENKTSEINFKEGARVSKHGTEEINVVFSSGVYDMTDIKNLETNRSMEINVVFGSATIYIAPETPVIIDGTAVFGKIYKDTHLRLANKDEYALRIEANSVFSSVDIIVKP